MIEFSEEELREIRHKNLTRIRRIGLEAKQKKSSQRVAYAEFEINGANGEELLKIIQCADWSGIELEIKELS